jgi:1-acyl-sn-glycerol-3-phosphate acyltransferase
MALFTMVDESAGARWGRRALTVPLYLGLGTLGLALLPLSVALALTVDAMRGGARFVATRCALGLTLYFVAEAIGIIASFVLWVADAMWPGGGAERTMRWNLGLQRRWARLLFYGATRLFAMRVEVSGADSVARGPLFLFCRHASVIDALLPAVFVSNPRTLRLGHVMKRELLWDPCLDIVGQRTRNAFVRRGSGERERELDLLRALARDLGERDGVLLFPEGTRYSPAKRARALKALEESGQGERLVQARRLRHVLPPRRGGATALLAARPDVDVVFLAHAGFDGVGNLNDLWNGKLVGRVIRLSFWRVASADIPRTSAGRIAWLDAQWQRLDDWVEAVSTAS